ncbi:hypothetical protein COCCADRAFT_113655 [Bipolaris zeicola 26-R-13]|uniref:Uncharacterized protein n=1 Tax=Cochliobolus carbonum (strain 26-R-13) TaxID=930089 RepID=W6Y5Z2_COCC2|nr:uncharacterized protein COCCADRAFT_113655 [Bipolaris zeicola 26-R-13]EUC26681.1 hypothetical protein COCCADRAFT_113655 [Bipolaris zeicola 26-R-13]
MWRVTLFLLNHGSFWQWGVCCLSVTKGHGLFRILPDYSFYNSHIHLGKPALWFKKIFHPAINSLSESCKTLGVISHTSYTRLKGLLLSDSKDTMYYSQHDPSGVVDNGRMFRVLTLLAGRRGSMSLSDETRKVC